jgi:tRNA (guanine-N7-)-methyltransferase
MKPKHLKAPFTWEERRPVLTDQVLYVPHHYQDHTAWTMPAWEDPAVFGKQGRVCIEYCSGNGNWVVEKAKDNPDTCWIAVEKRFDRVRKIWSKRENLKVKNLLIVCGEAVAFTKHYIPTQSIDEAYLNFPDPWPKPKHTKHRLVRQPFVTEIARVVKKGGVATFVSDDLPNCERMLEEMVKSTLWKAEFPFPHYVTDWPNYGYSFFDELWRAKGKTIQYLKFVNE